MIAVKGYEKGVTPGLVSSSTLGNPQPLQLALLTDRGGYRAGETVRLYRPIHPRDDRGSYRPFVYLKQVGSDERHYLAPLAALGKLHPDPVDVMEMPASVAPARTLSTNAADQALA